VIVRVANGRERWHMLRSPGWLSALAREGHPRFANLKSYAGANAGTNEVIAFARDEIGGAFTWDEIARFRERWKRPLVLKGIMHPADAARAIELGIDGIWVSNHGGRQIDHGLGSLDTLPEIVDVVNGRAKIIVDGGVQRGGDILKALALGADVVALGRLQGWGLAAGGEAGLVRMLEILEDELVSAMGLIGLTGMDKLTRKYVCAAEPVTDAHEMSSWVNMPVARII